MLVPLRLIRELLLGVLSFCIVLILIVPANLFILAAATVALMVWGVLRVVTVIEGQAREITRLRHEIHELERVIDAELERTKG